MIPNSDDDLGNLTPGIIQVENRQKTSLEQKKRRREIAYTKGTAQVKVWTLVLRSRQWERRSARLHLPFSYPAAIYPDLAKSWLQNGLETAALPWAGTWAGTWPVKNVNSAKCQTNPAWYDENTAEEQTCSSDWCRATRQCRLLVEEA